MSPSSFVSQPFFPLLSVRVTPPLISRASVVLSMGIRLQVLVNSVAEVQFGTASENRNR